MPAHPLEAFTTIRRQTSCGLQVVALHLSAQLAHHERLRVGRQATHANCAPPAARPGCADTAARCFADRQQQGSILGEAALLGTGREAPESALDLAKHRRRHGRHVLVRRRGRGVEHRGAANGKCVDAVDHQRMKVHADVQRRVEPLDHRHAASLERAAYPKPARAAPQPLRSGRDESAQHERGQFRIERKLRPQSVRHREDPLAHGRQRNHSVHPSGRSVAHAPADAAWAEAPSLTCENATARHQPHCLQRQRRKPWPRIPHFKNAATTNPGNAGASAAASRSARNVFQFACTAFHSTVASG